jgi:hypothetical protein
MTSLMTEYAPATAALEPQLNIRGEVVTPAMPAYEEAPGVEPQCAADAGPHRLSP